MKQDRILMAHGSGGLMSQQLIEEVFKEAWHNDIMEPMLDGAIFQLPPGKLAMSTDSFVITPLFFPGGDIGKLSICGTVNDLVACGARPLYLSTAFIIEEGLPVDDLRLIAASMAKTAREAGVKLVTGDTKVVERGSADQVFINTAGIGMIPQGIDYRPSRIRPGDAVLVTGTIGDHGLSIIAQRNNLGFNTPVTSDCAPLHEIGLVLEPFGEHVRCMRDPTRGGLATVLNELAAQSGWGVLVEETAIPIQPAVQGACEMLGMDPLYMANEGKMVVFCSPEAADDVLTALQSTTVGKSAALIGRVKEEPRGMVILRTPLGAERILSMLEGEHVPRIC